MGALYRPKSILSNLIVTENIGVHKPSAHQNILDGHMDIRDVEPPWNATSPSPLWGRQLQCRDMEEWLDVSHFISNFVLVS